MAALQELNRTYDEYFAAVNGYNRAQFQLYRAMGYPARILVCDRPLGELQNVDLSRPASIAPVCPQVIARPAHKPACRGRDATVGGVLSLALGEKQFDAHLAIFERSAPADQLGTVLGVDAKSAVAGDPIAAEDLEPSEARRGGRLLEALAKDHLAVDAAIHFVVHVLNARARQQTRHGMKHLVGLNANDGFLRRAPFGCVDIGSTAAGSAVGGPNSKAVAKAVRVWLLVPFIGEYSLAQMDSRTDLRRRRTHQPPL